MRSHTLNPFDENFAGAQHFEGVFHNYLATLALAGNSALAARKLGSEGANGALESFVFGGYRDRNRVAVDYERARRND